MVPETVEVNSVFLVAFRFIVIVNGVCSEIVNVDVVDTSRDKQLNFVWQEVTQPIVREYTLQALYEGFGLFVSAQVQEVVYQVHNIDRTITAGHRHIRTIWNKFDLLRHAE